MKKLAIAMGILIGMVSFAFGSYYEDERGYHHERMEHNYGHKYRDSYEDPCDKAYECLDNCPTVGYKKCLERCKKKYPCDELPW